MKNINDSLRGVAVAVAAEIADKPTAVGSENERALIQVVVCPRPAHVASLETDESDITVAP